MRACAGCPRRSERCHAECAEYLAERVLAASEGKKRRERLVDDYVSDSIERGGRRKSGEKTYKARRSHWWKFPPGWPGK